MQACQPLNFVFLLCYFVVSDQLLAQLVVGSTTLLRSVGRQQLMRLLQLCCLQRHTCSFLNVNLFVPLIEAIEAQQDIVYDAASIEESNSTSRPVNMVIHLPTSTSSLFFCLRLRGTCSSRSGTGSTPFHASSPSSSPINTCCIACNRASSSESMLSCLCGGECRALFATVNF